MNIRARLAKLEQQKADRGDFSHLSNAELEAEIRSINRNLAEDLALELGIAADEVTMEHLLNDCGDLPELAAYVRDEMMRGQVYLIDERQLWK